MALFDIDGTLLNADGQGRAAMEAGLSTCLGREISTAGIDFGGRTDISIIRAVLRRYDAHPDPADLTLKEAMLSFIRAGIQNWDDNRVTAIPGAGLLVDRLAKQPDISLGLVTGNAKLMAYRKLKSVGLGAYFPFGAYGDDDEDRATLIRIAIRRAESRFGLKFSPNDVCIVGDTTHDITAGKTVGVPCVAVATGFHTHAALAALRPFRLFTSLADTRRIENAILSAVGIS